MRRMILALAVLALIAASSSTLAAPPSNRHFQNTWQRTDRPVAEQQVSRTWMWGPGATTGVVSSRHAPLAAAARQIAGRSACLAPALRPLGPGRRV